MKRWLLRAAAMVLLMMTMTSAFAEGELRGWNQSAGYVYVTLGNYVQTVEGGQPGNTDRSWWWASNKMRNYAGELMPEPILWRVLSADDEKAFLLSEYILFAHRIHTDRNDYRVRGEDFSITELSALLNSEFMDTAFTAEEQSMLLENGSLGKVFLLTAADAANKAYGFLNNETRKAWGTEYAIRVTGLYVYSKRHGSHSCYWAATRSKSSKSHSRCTKADGSVGNLTADRDDEGVRPAVWLDMNAYTIASGRGTMNDPYVLVKGE